MEYVTLKGLNRDVSRIGLGTWSIGGLMGGGTDEQAALETILEALEQGITLLDTAPVYGLGRRRTRRSSLGAIWQAPRSNYRDQGRGGVARRPSVSELE
jgi:aryl-alcohol dehydrogenase-like predicted oxidoreductase